MNQTIKIILTAPKYPLKLDLFSVPMLHVCHITCITDTGLNYNFLAMHIFPIKCFKCIELLHVCLYLMPFYLVT